MEWETKSHGKGFGVKEPGRTGFILESTTLRFILESTT